MKIERQYPYVQQDYSQTQVFNRKEAQNYQRSLGAQSSLSQEISRILATHESGLYQLSNGQKIDAGRFQLLGGAKEKVSKAISVTISHKQERKAYYYQAPPGKYIASYKINCEGEEKDIKKIDSSLYYLAPNSTITKKDMEDWERSGEAGIKANVAGMASLDIGAKGAAKAKDEKIHEETYSNQTVVLELKARGHFYESKDPVTVTVDVYVEDIPKEKEVLPLQNRAVVEGGEAGGSIKASTTEGMVLKEDAARTTLNEATVRNAKAVGDILASGGMAKVVTEGQMERSVNLDSLREEIDRINTEIDKLKGEKKEAFQNLKENKEDKELSEMIKEEIKEIGEKIKKQEVKKEAYENQIQEILIDKGKGKEEEKK